MFHATLTLGLEATSGGDPINHEEISVNSGNSWCDEWTV
jgi:hypothetical protein